MSADADTLRALADRQAITDQIYRYCRSMDRIDAELGYSVWHEDGTADYGAEVYQGTGRGFIDFVCEQHRRALTHVHQVTNILIELDGERASSEAYVVSDLRAGAGEAVKHITTWGRYIDRWSKRDGRWAIDARIAIRDFAEMRDVTPAPLPARGARDHTDPSYAVLGAPK
jgi:hypothetical protein